MSRVRVDTLTAKQVRDVTHQENHFNTDARGYSWNKAAQKWLTQIGVNGKSIFLGYYDTEVEASAAYEAAKLIYHVIEDKS
jgi:hypothetical protein